MFYLFCLSMVIGGAEEQLLGTIFDIFVAGSETTSHTLGFALLFMIFHPQIQTKVQQEIDEILQGRQPSLADRGRYLSYIYKALRASFCCNINLIRKDYRIRKLPFKKFRDSALLRLLLYLTLPKRTRNAKGTPYPRSANSFSSFFTKSLNSSTKIDIVNKLG